MKKQKIPIGIDDFKELIDKGYYLVDKTEMIKKLIDSSVKATLFTRPRRLGKTINMSMLKYFFEDMRYDNGDKINNSYLFDNLYIATQGEEYLKHMGKYPVISITLKEAGMPNWNESFYGLRAAIAAEFKRHSYVLNSSVIDADDKKRYKAIMRLKDDKLLYLDALAFLSEMLYQYYKHKVIILIDEYDVPLQHAYTNHFYEEMISFIRMLFSSALKQNVYLEFGVVTGCLRISRESIFTGMNNLKTDTILQKQYANCFGFTEEEVMNICNDYEVQEYSELYKEWYNGYTFGDTNIYNPWDVLNYTYDIINKNITTPQCYWSNSRGNDIIRQLLQSADRNTKNEIEALLEGKEIIKSISEDITYDEIDKNINNLWNFLFFTGYLKKIAEINIREYKLALPNKEIQYTYRDHIKQWVEDAIAKFNKTKLLEALENKDTKAIQDEINNILNTVVSFYDTKENFYHGVLTGVLVAFGDYQLKSNREAGDGRADIIIIPLKSTKPAFIIELKLAGSQQSLQTKAQQGLQQIEDKKYDQELTNIACKEIIKYGIAFYNKLSYVIVQEKKNTKVKKKK